MKVTENDLPLGTTPHYATMHKWLQRFLWPCLVVLVIEASLSLPLIMVWMGWPTLSMTEICSEMTKVRYASDTIYCKAPHPLFSPSEAYGQTTAQDTWGIQPRPHYKKIGYRDLVRFRDERLAREAEAEKLREQVKNASPEEWAALSGNEAAAPAAQAASP